MIAAASVAVSIFVKKLVIFTLTDAAVVLVDFACWTSTFSTVIDKVSRANCTDAIDEETIVKLRANCANVSFVVGVSSFAGTFASH